MKNISAKVIADNNSPEGARITTLEVVYPRFIIAEINTHGLLAKSSASSRAIPTLTRVAEVSRSPYVPEKFNANIKGMSGGEELPYHVAMEARQVWMTGATVAVQQAAAFARLNVAKEHANRVLEPYAYVTTVLTATEWDNFFNLRISEHAQPEFDFLAKCITKALAESIPNHDEIHHLPYVTREEEISLPLKTLFSISSARCARVSYKSLVTGKMSTVEEDLALCKRLLESGHMSPFDHAALSDSRDPKTGMWVDAEYQGRFYGWMPLRSTYEKDKPCKRSAVLENRALRGQL